MTRKERQHICNRDGTVWHTPVKRPAKPSRMTIAGAKMQAGGSSISVFSGGASKGGYQMQAQRLESKRDEAVAWEHPTCPSCGSESCTTAVVKVR